MFGCIQAREEFKVLRSLAHHSLRHPYRSCAHITHQSTAASQQQKQGAQSPRPSPGSRFTPDHTTIYTVYVQCQVSNMTRSQPLELACMANTVQTTWPEICLTCLTSVALLLQQQRPILLASLLPPLHACTTHLRLLSINTRNVDASISFMPQPGPRHGRHLSNSVPMRTPAIRSSHAVMLII